MGLDAVELVMDVEEKFGVAIPDYVAGQILTVGNLFEYLLAQVQRPMTVCPTAAEFYRLRRHLVEVTGIAKREIRPSTRLNDLLRPRERRAAWMRFRQDNSISGWRVPTLGLLPELKFVFGSCYLLWIVGMVYWLTTVVPLEHAVVLTAAAAVLGGLLTFLITRPLAVTLPTDICTMAELTRAVALEPPKDQFGQRRIWARDEVWNELLASISDTLGVRRDRIEYHTSFVRDLGMD